MYNKNVIEELNELLSASEDDYYKLDYTQHVEEIATDMNDLDWKDILLGWNSKTYEWKFRFIGGLHYVDKEKIKTLLSKNIEEHESEELILELMCLLPAHAESNKLYYDLLEFSKKYWDKYPDKRSSLIMSTWSCGLSKRLLNELGYCSWKEAGVH